MHISRQFLSKTLLARNCITLKFQLLVLNPIKMNEKKRPTWFFSFGISMETMMHGRVHLWIILAGRTTKAVTVSYITMNFPQGFDEGYMIAGSLLSLSSLPATTITPRLLFGTLYLLHEGTVHHCWPSFLQKSSLLVSIVSQYFLLKSID